MITRIDKMEASYRSHDLLACAYPTSIPVSHCFCDGYSVAVLVVDHSL